LVFTASGRRGCDRAGGGADELEEDRRLADLDLPARFVRELQRMGVAGSRALP
jgi:hypothetical protein